MGVEATSVETTGTGITGFFAAGDGCTILHPFDGMSWPAQSSGTSNDLFGLWVTSDTASFAGGALGTELNSDWKTRIRVG